MKPCAESICFIFVGRPGFSAPAARGKTHGRFPVISGFVGNAANRSLFWREPYFKTPIFRSLFGSE